MKVIYRISPPVKDQELNALFASAWPDRRGAVLRRPSGTAHNKTRTDVGRSKTAPLQRILRHASFYVCAYENKQLIGFAKIIGDGGVHGFLLDPTVAPESQRQGVGRKLVETCAREARRRGIEWLHVDFEPRLAPFYRACGFRPTRAGLRNLKSENSRVSKT
jgi:GNAT superfamily N-acetyltransferase